MNVLPVFMATSAEPCAWLSAWHALSTASLSACGGRSGNNRRRADRSASRAEGPPVRKPTRRPPELMYFVLRQRLIGVLLQLRLVVECVHLAGAFIIRKMQCLALPK